jgi:hypothetical protein
MQSIMPGRDSIGAQRLVEHLAELEPEACFITQIKLNLNLNHRPAAAERQSQ